MIRPISAYHFNWETTFQNLPMNNYNTFAYTTCLINCTASIDPYFYILLLMRVIVSDFNKDHHIQNISQELQFSLTIYITANKILYRDDNSVLRWN